MAEPSPWPSDRQLLDATRTGSDDAWSEIVARHGPAVRAVADASPQAKRTPDEALAQVRRELDGTTPVEQPSVRAVRPRALAALVGGTYTPEPLTGVAEDAVVPAVAVTTGEGLSPQPVAATPIELERVATAFGTLPDDWQTVLWHRWVDLEPVATVASHMGRSVTETRALMSTADAGLFEAVLASEPAAAVRPGCRDIVPLLGGARRGTLAATQQRVVEAHVRGETRHGDPTPCSDCGRRLAIAAGLAVLVPRAVVPGITGLDVARYRSLVGAGSAAIGVAALTEQRTARVSKLTRLGAAAAVIAALLGAAFLIRAPFGDLDRQIADLADSIPTTDPVGGPDQPGGGSDGETGGPDGPDGGLPNRIELLFPGAPQGVIYVPGGPALDLGLELSTPAPVFAGATGTVDAALTNNNDADPATVEFEIRPSAGLAFDRITEGAASCRPVGETGATCALQLDPAETQQFSFRFSVADDVSDRLSVVPSIRSASLQVPVEFVADLVVGQVGRSELVVAGDSLGGCTDGDPGCVGGRKDTSTAPVELPAAASIESALLVWEGDGDGWAAGLDVAPPGDAPTVTVSTQPDLGGASTPSGRNLEGFASIADVTELVRDAGAGDYAVTRPTGSTGSGVWTLIVVTDDRSQPRRLVVVTQPAVGTGPDQDVDISVPLDGSSPPPTGSTRSLVLQLRAAGSPGVHSVTVDGAPVGGRDPFELAGEQSGVATYDLDIENSPLLIQASSDDGTVRLSVVAFALDITP